MKYLNLIVLLIIFVLLIVQLVYSQTFIKGSKFHVKGRHEIEDDKVKYDFQIEMVLSKFNVKKKDTTFSLYFEGDFANNYNIILLNSTQNLVVNQTLRITANLYPDPQKVTFTNVPQTQNLTLVIQKRTQRWVSGVVKLAGVGIDNNETEYIEQDYIPVVYDNGKIVKNPLKLKFLGASVTCEMVLDYFRCVAVLNMDGFSSFAT
ncbi:hypothetical protein ABK040_004635 [Willaertia magna]